MAKQVSYHMVVERLRIQAQESQRIAKAAREFAKAATALARARSQLSGLIDEWLSPDNQGKAELQAAVLMAAQRVQRAEIRYALRMEHLTKRPPSSNFLDE